MPTITMTTMMPTMMTTMTTLTPTIPVFAKKTAFLVLFVVEKPKE